MEIKARIKHNVDAAKALAHITVYKKQNPKKHFIGITIFRFILLLPVLLFYLYLQYVKKTNDIVYSFEGYVLLLIVFGAFLIFMGFWYYFIFPKMQYNSMGKMKELVDQYVFFDEYFVDTVDSEEYNEKTELQYTMLYMVYETSRYFFIYRSKNQVYIVDKETIEGGTAEDLRNKLREYVKDKYFICKY